MPTTLENITAGMNLINVAIPGITSLIVTLRSGKTIDLVALMADTDKRVAETIAEGEAFLAEPDPHEPE